MSAHRAVLAQVWYSAGWSRSTLAAFRAALAAAAEQARVQAQPEAVCRLLAHWQQQSVTLAAARSAWLADLGTQLSVTANFVRKADRLALAQYLLSGQLLDADVGSVVMFAVPKGGYGERALSESCLQVRAGARSMHARTCMRVCVHACMQKQRAARTAASGVRRCQLAAMDAENASPPACCHRHCRFLA